MIVRTRPRRTTAVSGTKREDTAPPAALEYAFYLYMAYSYVAEMLDISIPLLGAITLTGLAALCIRHLGFRLAAFKPIKIPLIYALSSMAIQVLVHNESIMSESVRALINFINFIIVMLTLSLRPGFFNRYIIVLLFDCLSVLPFLTLSDAASAVARANIEAPSTLSNANSLGGNFGFIAAYFIMLGFEGKRDGVRLLLWVIAVGCLFVVGLSVSRGALLSFALAIVVFFRHLLKYGLFPVTVLILLSGFLFFSGLFSRAVQSYTARATEETGRETIWPAVVERIRDNLLTGVGDSEVERYVPELGEKVTPHNTFLKIGLGSGIVPLLFFAAFWLKAGRAAVTLEQTKAPGARCWLPLLTYCFVNANVGDVMPPTIVVLTLILTNYQWQTHAPRWRRTPSRLQRAVGTNARIAPRFTPHRYSSR